MSVEVRGALDSALAARDAEATVTALASLDAGRLDPRRLATVVNLLAQMRHNVAAHSAYEAGCAKHGVAALVGAGLSLNGLIYACCREPSMVPRAMALWALLSECGVAPDAVPTEKLLSANLSQRMYDEAFDVFLGALEGGLKLGAAVCTALIRSSFGEPRLAQMAYAVYLSMKAPAGDSGGGGGGGGGASLGVDDLVQLQRACLAEGTLEQCLNLEHELRALGHQATSADRSALVVKLAAEPSAAMTSRATALFTATIQREGHTPSEAAYGAILALTSRAALSRANVDAVGAAHALLTQIVNAGWTPPVAGVTTLLYREGGRYRRHVDQANDVTVGDGARRSVSMVLFLTPDGWNAESDGSELRIHQRDGSDPVDIAPVAGTLVMFDSALCPHEVLVTNRPRIVLAIWYPESKADTGPAASAALYAPESGSVAKAATARIRGGSAPKDCASGATGMPLAQQPTPAAAAASSSASIWDGPSPQFAHASAWAVLAAVLVAAWWQGSDFASTKPTATFWGAAIGLAAFFAWLAVDLPDYKDEEANGDSEEEDVDVAQGDKPKRE